MPDDLNSLSVQLNRLAAALDLDGPADSAGWGAFADDLLDLIAAGIRRRSIDGQRAPDGSPWKPNEPKYAARKGGQPIGVLTGEMLSEGQLEGERTITRDQASMSYGTTKSAKDKADWFSPDRPFYDLDPEIEAAMNELIRRRLERVCVGGEVGG